MNLLCLPLGLEAVPIRRCDASIRALRLILVRLARQGSDSQKRRGEDHDHRRCIAQGRSTTHQVDSAWSPRERSLLASAITREKQGPTDDEYQERAPLPPGQSRGLVRNVRHPSKNRSDDRREAGTPPTAPTTRTATSMASLISPRRHPRTTNTAMIPRTTQS